MTKVAAYKEKVKPPSESNTVVTPAAAEYWQYVTTNFFLKSWFGKFYQYTVESHKFEVL